MMNFKNHFGIDDLTPQDISPGNLLLIGFLIPRKLTVDDVAAGTSLDINTVNNILIGEISVSPEIGLRLDKYFDMEGGFWHRLQQEYEAALKHTYETFFENGKRKYKIPVRTN